MTPDERRQYAILLEIATRANRVANTTFALNIRPASLWASENGKQRWMRQMQALIDSLISFDPHSDVHKQLLDDPDPEGTMRRLRGEQEDQVPRVWPDTGELRDVWR